MRSADTGLSFTFRGSVSHESELLIRESNGAVLLMDKAALATPVAKSMAAVAATVIIVEGRPDTTSLATALDAIRSTSAGRVVGVGGGSLLDLVKIAAVDATALSQTECRPVLVPTGREAYRAAAPFAVLDTDGQRPTRTDVAFASGHVLIVEEILASTDSVTIALTKADLAVIAVECLLSTRSTPFSAELAAAVLTIASDNVRSGPSAVAGLDSLSGIAVASILAAEAMMMARLGLSHAMASPLGTVSGQTHDAFNAILGPHAIRMLGPSPGLGRVATTLGVANDPNVVAEAVDRLRMDAGLPTSLRELGVTWNQMREALPMAQKSSGIPALPRRLRRSEFEDFARSAWEGHAQSSSATEEQPRAST